MKVGTDGVLLGAWTKAVEGQILDIGTGTGLIALMVAQRMPNAQLTAIEIDSLAVQDAQDNFANSPWEKRINLVCSDFRTYQPSDNFEKIISNPPFYTDSPKTRDAQRDLARKTTFDFFEKLVEFANKYLTPSGTLDVILPPSIQKEFLFAAWCHSLYPQRITRIFTKREKPVKRIMLALGRTKSELIEDDLVIYDTEGNFTEQYRNLTKEFYLNF